MHFCENCGFTVADTQKPPVPCPHCGFETWIYEPAEEELEADVRC